MNDNIKQFIQEHRNAIDEAVPDAHGWKSLEHTLGRLHNGDVLEQFVASNRVLLDAEVPSECIWEGIEQYLNAAGAKSTGEETVTPEHLPSTADCDPLEQFIRSNRADLDHAVPDLRVWSGIEQSIPAPKSSAKIRQLPWQHSIVRIAASITLLLAGVGLGLFYARSTANAENGMKMSEVSTEYAELEQYYQRDIAGKQVKLASYTGSQPAEVQEDMVQLDDIMAELQKELAGIPPGNREQVVRAMIANYKAKVSILKRVLDHLEESKSESNNNRKKHEINNI